MDNRLSTLGKILAFATLIIAIRSATLIDWRSLKQLNFTEPPLVDTLSVDTDAYLRLAANWSKTGTFGFEDSTGRVTPTAFRPMLYPWLLSWLAFDDPYPPLAVAALNLGIGFATVFLTWAIGIKLHLQAKWATAAALAVALDPILLRAGQSAMTETLAAFLVALAWYLWLVVWPPQDVVKGYCPSSRSAAQWFSLVGLGLVMGLAILARPTAAPWAGLCIASCTLVGCVCWKRRITDSLILMICVSVCVTPWVLRNWSQLGKPIWATSHGGYTLLLANNSSLYAHFRQHGPSRNWDATSFHQLWERRLANPVEDLALDDEPASTDAAERKQAATSAHDSLNELADDRRAYEAAWQTIRSNPRMFLLSCCYRAGWFWAWWPNQSSWQTRMAIGLWYAVFCLMACAGMARLVRSRRITSWVLPGILLFSLTIVHAVYWSNMRMRAPLVSQIYLLAFLVPSERRSYSSRLASTETGNLPGRSNG
ncbi:MAG: hypothetical protein KDB22_19130 [Planctomycetales bacterium]|nr:hypothetical protein [Planctomycetales bacterium]